MVVFPAQCLYGLAAHALRPRAVEKIFELKERPRRNPVLVLVKDQAMLESLVTHVPETARILMEQFWPGSLTLVFHAQSRVPAVLTAGTGKIGIRIPAHPVARALVNRLDFPVTGTSANCSGQPGTVIPDQLPPAFFRQVGLVLDAGSLKGGTGSTIVDVTGYPPAILREGLISEKQIQKALA